MSFRIKTSNSFTPLGYGIYFAVTLFMLVIMLTRNNPTAWEYFDITSIQRAGGHASNFALSMLLVFVSGAMNMLKRISWKYIFSVAGIMVTSNFIIELFIPVLNTRDIVDAIYGALGVVTSLLLLLLMYKSGIKKAAS